VEDCFSNTDLLHHGQLPAATALLRAVASLLVPQLGAQPFARVSKLKN
jgi:hypothetical protein